jgi:hypothetical protein
MNQYDDELGRAIQDAVADVRPRGTLDDIRSRTDKVVPMKSRWILPILAAAAVLAVVVAGTFWLTGDDTTPSPSGTPTQGATTGGNGATTPPPGGTTMRAVPVYYVGETAHGKRLFREFHREAVQNGLPDGVAYVSARIAVDGKPLDPDYTNPWPAGARWAYSSSDRNLITVSLSGNLHDRPVGMSQADAELAVQQLVFSVQAGFGKGRVPVQLLLHGQHTDTILGVPASEPLAAGNPDDLQSPVQVDDPVDGATVSSPFTVTGRAATFEANVVWELKQGDTVVKKGFTTAQECCTLAPYSFRVEAPAGSYTLVVHDTDESGQNLPVDQDSKEITVQ